MGPRTINRSLKVIGVVPNHRFHLYTNLYTVIFTKVFPLPPNMKANPTPIVVCMQLFFKQCPSVLMCTTVHPHVTQHEYPSNNISIFPYLMYFYFFIAGKKIMLRAFVLVSTFVPTGDTMVAWTFAVPHTLAAASTLTGLALSF